jgi:hypothetical protein
MKVQSLEQGYVFAMGQSMVFSLTVYTGEEKQPMIMVTIIFVGASGNEPHICPYHAHIMSMSCPAHVHVRQ